MMDNRDLIDMRLKAIARASELADLEAIAARCVDEDDLALKLDGIRRTMRLWHENYFTDDEALEWIEAIASGTWEEM
jgi:hypothetical protein